MGDPLLTLAQILSASKNNIRQDNKWFHYFRPSVDGLKRFIKIIITPEVLVSIKINAIIKGDKYDFLLMFTIINLFVSEHLRRIYQRLTIAPHSIQTWLLKMVYLDGQV